MGKKKKKQKNNAIYLLLFIIAMCNICVKKKFLLNVDILQREMKPTLPIKKTKFH